MLLSRPRTVIMYALAANGITSAASTVALANFTPRIENLPAQCQAIYTRPISGCTAGDFSGDNAKCSSACVNGLVEIQKLVDRDCANVDVPETSIIGVFLLGTGIPILCPGVQVTTIAPSASKTQQLQTSSQAAATTTEDAASSTSTTEETSSAAASSTLRTSVVSTPAAVAPTLATLRPASSRTSTSSAKASSTASSQKSNSESGGGSPFDVQATGGTSSFRDRWPLTTALTVGVVMLLCAIL